jgi:cysteine synthase
MSDRLRNSPSASARHEGIPTGISAGAAIAVAIEIGARRTLRVTIAVIIPDLAECYLSTALFEGL